MVLRFFSLLGLCSSLALAEPDDGHVLSQKTWGPPKGMLLKLESTSFLSNGQLKMVNNGSWSTGTSRYQGGQTLSAKWIEGNILEVDFERRRATYRRFLNGQRTNEIQPSPLEATIVHLKQDGEGWAAKVVKRREKEKVKEEVEDNEDEGDENDAKEKEVDAKRLEKELKEVEASMENEYSLSLFGERARKVGETWKVGKPMLPWFNDEKVLNGEATVTFEKILEVEGDPAAVLTYSAAVQSEREGEQKVVIAFEGKGRLVRSLKHLVDYEVSGQGNIEMKVETGESSYVETVGKYELMRKIELSPIEDKE